MANVIDSLNFDGVTEGIFTLPYGTCATAQGTAAKVVTATNFVLEPGARIAVKFTYANTVASPTLNVNSTGAKAIYWHGAALASDQYWQAGAVLDFIYNGAQWELIGVAKDNNNTYGAAGSSLGLVKSGGDVSISDGVITVNIDAAPTSHASSATTYGQATSSNYGHVKLSDSVSSTSAANSGIGASPKAVKLAYDLANAALPKSGGTLTASSGNSPLTLKSASTKSNLQFSNSSGTHLGYVGYDANGNPVIGNAVNATEKVIMHGGNIYDYAPMKDHTHDDRYYTETEIDNKIDAIDWFNSGTAITAGADLNTYTTPGKYFIGSESGAQGLTNCPTSTNFCMYVLVRTSGGSKTQLIMTLNGRIYLRSCNSSGTWRDWQECATSGSSASFNTVSTDGAVNCGGGFNVNKKADGTIGGSSLDIYHTSTPYIDFHHGGTTTDYTSRIIETASGTLSINGVKCTSGGTIEANATNTARSGSTLRNIEVKNNAGTAQVSTNHIYFTRK